MKKIFLILSVLAVVTLSSCNGFYTHIGTTSGRSMKEGVASKRVWFGLAFNVDVSIATAAKNGGITKVATVDYIMKPGLFNVLYKTTVSGE